jgi:ankyrin repeat protein
LAANNGHIAVAKLLHANGARLDIASQNGDVPLHQAALGGHSNTVAWLLEKRLKDKDFSTVSLNAANYLGLTALQNTLHRFHVEVVRLLHDSGCDVESLDPYGHSPLEWISRMPEYPRLFRMVQQFSIQ